MIFKLAFPENGGIQRAASGPASPMVVVVCFEFFKSPVPTTIWQSCFPASASAELQYFAALPLCILLRFHGGCPAGGSINCAIDGRGAIPLNADWTEVGLKEVWPTVQFLVGKILNKLYIILGEELN